MGENADKAEALNEKLTHEEVSEMLATVSSPSRPPLFPLYSYLSNKNACV